MRAPDSYRDFYVTLHAKTRIDVIAAGRSRRSGVPGVCAGLAASAAIRSGVLDEGHIGPDSGA